MELPQWNVHMLYHFSHESMSKHPEAHANRRAFLISNALELLNALLSALVVTIECPPREFRLHKLSDPLVNRSLLPKD